MKTLLALLLLLPLTVNAGLFDTMIPAPSAQDDAVPLVITDGGIEWLIVSYTNILGKSTCTFTNLNVAASVKAEMDGVKTVAELRALHPEWNVKISDLSNYVRYRCYLMNPIKVSSAILGYRSLYEIAPIIAWRDSGMVGTIPMVKIGTIATQTVCEFWYVVKVGKDIVGIATNADGVRGATRCE